MTSTFKKAKMIAETCTAGSAAGDPPERAGKANYFCSLMFTPVAQKVVPFVTQSVTGAVVALIFAAFYRKKP